MSKPTTHALLVFAGSSEFAAGRATLTETERRLQLTIGSNCPRAAVGARPPILLRCEPEA